MKIALIGCGKMGKLIDEMAQVRGHRIVARLSSTSPDWAEVEEADLCMEFTAPHCAVSHIHRCAELKKNVVVGTTGWYDQLPAIKAASQEIGILYAPNFSLGVFLWMQMVRHSAQLMNAYADYDIGGIEWHHKEKRDAPSGTARHMAETVEREVERVSQLNVVSVRQGSNAGTHSLVYDSPVDTITITHEARDRRGMALGALQAAEWLFGKKGLYTLEDVWKGVLPH